MKNDITVSIAFCVFNGEKYISEQLDSLMRQTLLPNEIVFVDDGSTDNTHRIVNDFANSHFIKTSIFINKENLHFTGNFLKAASLCTGDVIVFCDQDDLWHPRKLEICIAEFKKQTADLLVHEGRVINEEGEIIDKKIPNLENVEKWFDQPPFDRPSKGFAMMVSKNLITEFLSWWDWEDYSKFRKQFGLPLGHDLLLYAFALHRYKIAFVKEELVYYRIHSNNVTASISLTKGMQYKIIQYFKNLKFSNESYSLPALKWSEEVNFLSRYMSRVPLDIKIPGLIILRDWLKIRSKYYFLRSEIYKKDNSLFKRFSCISKIYKEGGYKSVEKSGFGWRSIFKDLLLSFRLN